MVMCSVYGCGHRSGRDGGSVRFHSFPAVTKYTTSDKKALVLCRRSLWLLRICRQDLDDAKVTKQYARVCSYHFVSGAPAILEDTSNVDWAPSLHLGHDFFDGKRKLRKRKKKFSPKCQCDSYVACAKYRRNCKKKNITDDDDDTSYASKYACCVMHDEEYKDSQTERSMSSSESTTSDTSESSSEFEDCSLATIKPENSTNNACITHIAVSSADAHSRNIQSEDTCNITSHSEEAFSNYISTKDIDFEIEIPTEADEALLTVVKSEDNLHEIPDEFTQTIFSKLVSGPKKCDASKQLSCVTHAKAFSAAETLLRYMMNQDEVNDVDVNFILNLAQKIKERIK